MIGRGARRVIELDRMGMACGNFVNLHIDIFTSTSTYAVPSKRELLRRDSRLSRREPISGNVALVTRD
jgi:hypothetical protein